MQEQKKVEQDVENTVVRDGFTRPGDRPGAGEEMKRKTSRRDAPPAPGEKIEGDSSEGDSDE